MATTESEGVTQVWYIVFCRTKLDNWMLRRLKYGHVYAMRKSPGGSMWIIIDPTTTIINASLLPVELCPNPADYKDTTIKVLRYVSKLRENDEYSLKFGPITCVSVVKLLLGVKNRLILTPYQLYQELLKRGAKHG